MWKENLGRVQWQQRAPASEPGSRGHQIVRQGVGRTVDSAQTVGIYVGGRVAGSPTAE